MQLAQALCGILNKYRDQGIPELSDMVWYLGDGSLLGAWRDNSIIPNDNDVDLSMWFPGHTQEQSANALELLYKRLCEEDLPDTIINLYQRSAGARANKIHIYDPWTTKKDQWKS